MASFRVADQIRECRQDRPPRPIGITVDDRHHP
jgi:hypothetical protein